MSRNSAPQSILIDAVKINYLHTLQYGMRSEATGDNHFGMDFTGFEFWEGSGLQIIDPGEVLDYAGIREFSRFK